MPTILFAWELGANLGHITTIGPIAHELRRRGHRVLAALRDLSRAELLGDVELLPAPFCHTLRRPVVTYADLLANAGFGDRSTLASHVKAWTNLIRLVNPDVLICDHSPTALLAGRAAGVRCLTVGTGFYVPPNVSPLPSLVPGTPSSEEQLVENVRQFLDVVRLADLYHGIEAHLLTTIPELDHFGPRSDVEYFGPACQSFGAAPVWPVTTGPRVFVYLRPFPGLDALLEALRRIGASVVTAPVDVNLAIADADLVVCHASHGVTSRAVIQGRPTLLFPTQAEQYLLGCIVERVAAGRIARPGNIEADLEAAISLKVPRFDSPVNPVARIADRIEVPRCLGSCLSR